MKKFLLIFTFVLLLAGIPITVFLVKQRQEIRQKAAPATTLSFDLPTITKNVDENFDLKVMINTGTNQISSAKLSINFQNTYLEAVSVNKGTFFDNILEAGIVDNTNGKVTITLSSISSAKSSQGDELLATITFKTKALTPTNTPSEINMTGSETIGQEADLVSRNLLVSSGKTMVTVSQAAQPSPSPTTTPSASPLATPSTVPTVAPSATPANSPSATPTQVTRITSPVNGSSITNRRPQIIGTSFPNGLIVLSINTNPVTSANFNANASGNWSFTPTTDLALGTFTITVTGQDPINTGVVESTTSTFTITAGSGGTNIATPTPNPTATPHPTPTATPGSSPQPTPTATPGTSGSLSTPRPSTITTPTTGTTLPTIWITTISLLLLFFGISFAFIKK